MKIKLDDTNSTKSKVVDISTCIKKNKVKIDQRSGVEITAVKPQKKKKLKGKFVFKYSQEIEKGILGEGNLIFCCMGRQVNYFGSVSWSAKEQQLS